MAPPALPPSTLQNIERIAAELTDGKPREVTPEEIAGYWTELERAPAHAQQVLQEQRLIRSPAWEADAGELAMVLKVIGAYADRQVGLIVPARGRWRLVLVPFATTCDYAQECAHKPQTRRKLIGKRGCCRKAKHLGADADSITSFAADTRQDFDHLGGEIIFTVNPADLKSGAHPVRRSDRADGGHPQA